MEEVFLQGSPPLVFRVVLRGNLGAHASTGQTLILCTQICRQYAAKKAIGHRSLEFWSSEEVLAGQELGSLT